jgi:hypothetical protein
MGQAKFSVRETQKKFINRYKAHGFKDKSSLVRAALDHFQTALENEKLKESALLYAKVYIEDQELKALTESALPGWPE